MGKNMVKTQWFLVQIFPKANPLSTASQLVCVKCHWLFSGGNNDVGL